MGPEFDVPTPQPHFHPSTYVTPQHFVVDELHTLNLGLFAVYVLTGLWACISEDVFDIGGAHSMEHMYELAAQRIEIDMKGWFRAQRKKHPKRPLYQVPDFKLASLGNKEKPTLYAKAAETGSLVRYTADLVGRYRGILERGEALHAAGESLVQYLTITRESGPQLTHSARQGIADAIVRFHALREEAGIPWTPKFHLSLHLVDQCKEYGNPLHVATWVDEGLNRQLRDVCAKPHALVWARRVLATTTHVLSSTNSGQKRPRLG